MSPWRPAAAPSGRPIVGTAARLAEHLEVDPAEAERAILAAQLPAWGTDAWGRPVWRLADVEHALGREPQEISRRPNGPIPGTRGAARRQNASALPREPAQGGRRAAARGHGGPDRQNAREHSTRVVGGEG